MSKSKDATMWDKLELFLKNVRRVYLFGSPGIGKSFTSHKLLTASLSNGEEDFERVYQCTLNEDTVTQELMGHYIPSGNKFVWHDGALALALRHGALVINELPRASSSVRDLMLAVLDDHEICKITLPTGEILKPHDGFRVICTGNDSPQDAGLDRALIDRFDIIMELKRPHPEIIIRLNDMIKGLGDMVGNSYGDDVSRQLSVRKAFTFASLWASGEHKVDDLAQMLFPDRAKDFAMLFKVNEAEKLGGS